MGKLTGFIGNCVVVLVLVAMIGAGSAGIERNGNVTFNFFDFFGRIFEAFAVIVGDDD
ncbi:MAG: hypothetical protein AAFR31_21480 [Cyanobacteria bacterium J06627_8]